ncbi:hypothetical protein [Amycolatopsis sp. WAC 01416]|uniref:hypothetical protein n=1 Tax=Amycolatopsis sp. WAC 01416 TaxID=2203196 RepID=UPI00131520D2|nr:hypothetical protein [Amycolatopsis sp. WAC 01416]
MPEILDIITAATEAYRKFEATHPEREIRQAVGNAVRFLAADLKSAAELTAGTQERA